MSIPDILQERVQQDGFEDAKQQALVSLLVATAQLRQALNRACDPYGITHDQYNVLRILRGVHPEGHPRYEISDRLIERAPDVTRILDRLQQNGYVERYRSPEDGRLSIARITEEGLRLLTEMDDAIREVREHNLDRFSDDECEVLSQMCMTIYENASASETH